MITSAANRDVRALRRLRNKTNRDRLGLVLVEGPTALTTVMSNDGVLDRIVVTPRGDLKLAALVKQARESGAQKIVVSDSIMATLCETSSAPAIYAVVRAPRVALAQGASFFRLAVAGVRDPGELGAVLRTAASFGAGGVYCLPGCADPYSPKAIRASAGAAWKIPISPTTTWTTIEADAAKHRMTPMLLESGIPLDGTELPPKLLLVMDVLGDSLPGAMRLEAIPTRPGLSAALALPVVLSDWTRRHRG